MSQKMENNNETKDKVNYQLMSVQILPIMQVERLFWNPVILNSSSTTIPVFLGVAEIIVGSLLFCDVGIVNRFCTLFLTKNSRTFKDTIDHFSRTPFSCAKKESWVYVFFQFFHNMSNFILKVFLCLLLSGTWEFRSDKVSTKIQGLSRPSFF